MSGNGKRVALLDDNNILSVYMDENSVDPVLRTEGVSEAVISFDGSAVAYVKSFLDGENIVTGSGDLYIYNFADKTNVKIAENVAGGGMKYNNSTIALAADGSYVAYSKFPDEQLVFSDMDLYICDAKGEKEQCIAKSEAYPVVVSSGGKYVYYEKNQKFFIHTDKEDKKLDSGISQVRAIFNEEQTEVIFSGSDKTYWYNVKEDVPVKLADSPLKDLNPAGLPNMAKTIVINQGIYGVKTLDNMLFTTDQAIYKLDKKAKKADYITDVYKGRYHIIGFSWNYDYYSGLQVSENGKQMLFIKNSKLYSADIKDVSTQKCVSENLEVKNFTASNDLKKIYIVTQDDELFYLKNGKPVQLSYDVSAAYKSTPPGVTVYDSYDSYTLMDFTPNIHYSDELGGVLFVEDGDLYYAKTDSSSKIMLQEDVHGMICSSDDVVLYFTKSSTEDGTLLVNRVEDLKNTITL